MNWLAKLWNEYPRFRLVTKTSWSAAPLVFSPSARFSYLSLCTQFIIGGFFLDALRHMYMLYDATSVYGAGNAQVPVRGHPNFHSVAALRGLPSHSR